MKDILLALNNYKADHGEFPPAIVHDSHGKPMHSWRVLILPYLDANDLFERYDLDEPWNGPNNRLLLDEMPNVFRCPGHGHHGKEMGRGFTNYVLIRGETFPANGKIDSNAPWNRDGIIATDVNRHAVSWTSPDDITTQEFRELFAPNGNSSEDTNHVGGILVVGYKDGVVRVVSNSVDQMTVDEMISDRNDW